MLKKLIGDPTQTGFWGGNSQSEIGLGSEFQIVNYVFRVTLGLVCVTVKCCLIDLSQHCLSLLWFVFFHFSVSTCRSSFVFKYFKKDFSKPCVESICQ